MADPSGSGVFKDLARAQAHVKIDEVARLMAETEATCSNLAATVVSLVEGLNEEADLDAAVAEIRSTEEHCVSKARVALVHLAEAKCNFSKVCKQQETPNHYICFICLVIIFSFYFTCLVFIFSFTWITSFYFTCLVVIFSFTWITIFHHDISKGPPCA